MSRYVHKTKNGRDIAYGFDPKGGGYYIQVYLLEEEKKDENDELAYELASNSAFISVFKEDKEDKGPASVGYSNGQIIKEMEFWGLPWEHISQVALDLPY